MGSFPVILRVDQQPRGSDLNLGVPGRAEYGYGSGSEVLGNDFTSRHSRMCILSWSLRASKSKISPNGRIPAEEAVLKVVSRNKMDKPETAYRYDGLERKEE